jgi:hypothetical protein
MRSFITNVFKSTDFSVFNNTVLRLSSAVLWAGLQNIPLLVSQNDTSRTHIFQRN